MIHARTCLLAGLLLVLVASCSRAPTGESPSADEPLTARVGVFLFVQHPVIDEIYRGFREELDTEVPAASDIEYVERNADGDAAQSNAIATFFATGDFDLVFVVGLPAAQALKAAGVKHPVLFGGPPDPVAAGLVPSLQDHGTNFSGTRYLPPASAILDVFNSAFPQAREVAVLHNPGEENSMAVVRAFLEAAKQQSLKVRDLGATNAAEIEAALRDLAVRSPDGLFLPTDNLVYSNLDRIIDQAKAHGIPVFNCTRLSVERGAVFSLATDYHRVGAITAGLARRILFEDAAPRDLDVIDIREGSLYVKSGDETIADVEPPTDFTLVRVP